MNNNENNHAQKYIIFTTIVGGLAGLLFGMDFGVINGTLDLMMKYWSLSIEQGQLITSSLLMGALVGSLCSGYLANRLGRRKVMIFAGAIFTVGSILAACSINYHMMVTMRFILGIAVGIASFVSPLFLAEIAPYKSRGLVIAVYQLMITLGIFLVFINNAILARFELWRIMIGAIAIPGLLMWIGVIFLPETPRWLMLKNKEQQAIEVLNKLRANTKEVEFEIKEIKKILSNHKKEKFTTIITSKQFLAVLLIGMFMQLYQQFDGLNTFMYYSGFIYDSLGFDKEVQGWLTVLIGLINMLSTIFAMLFIDKIGRKHLLYLGVGLMSISMLGMVSIFYFHNFSLFNRTIFVVLSLIFIFARAASTGPLAWIMCSEIFPLRYREVGVTFTTATNWFCNSLIGGFSLTAFHYLGFTITFSVFISILILGLFIIYFFIPETKGIPLEEIETNIANGIRLRDIGNRTNV